MSLWETFLGWFDDSETLELDAYVGELSSEVFFKKLAIQSAINLIANAVSKSEFLTFDEGDKLRGENYYLFNVEPNKNKSANKFWRDVIYKLVYENECLVIQQNGEFYVADSYNVNRFAFKEYIYDNVTIDDYYLRNASYSESDVLHFELHNKKIRQVIDGLYKSYSDLIEISQQNYKRNNSRRGKVKMDASWSQDEESQKKLDDLFENKFKKFFEAEGGAVLPLPDGIEYEELESNIGTKGGADNQQIRSFIDDIFDFVARAFNIPPVILKGDVADTENAFNNFLTYCIDPLAELLSDEINRKLYGKERYLNRTYMKVDTSNIKAADITNIANALDVLTRIGAYSVDDSLKKLGMEPLETDWSQARWMTKNYQNIKKRFEGGE